MKSYLRRMLVVMSINCVANLCSSVDFRDWVSCLSLSVLGKKQTANPRESQPIASRNLRSHPPVGRIRG